MPVNFSIWLHSLAIVVTAYLLGSIPTGYLLVRFFRKQDIRTLGSGNIGATNVMRSGAKGLGAATFLLDALKGVAALAPKLRSHGVSRDTTRYCVIMKRVESFSSSSTERP